MGILSAAGAELSIRNFQACETRLDECKQKLDEWRAKRHVHLNSVVQSNTHQRRLRGRQLKWILPYSLLGVSLPRHIEYGRKLIWESLSFVYAFSFRKMAAYVFGRSEAVLVRNNTI